MIGRRPDAVAVVQEQFAFLHRRARQACAQVCHGAAKNVYTQQHLPATDPDAAAAILHK